MLLARCIGIKFSASFSIFFSTIIAIAVAVVIPSRAPSYVLESIGGDIAKIVIADIDDYLMHTTGVKCGIWEWWQLGSPLGRQRQRKFASAHLVQALD